MIREARRGSPRGWCRNPSRAQLARCRFGYAESGARVPSDALRDRRRTVRGRARRLAPGSACLRSGARFRASISPITATAATRWPRFIRPASRRRRTRCCSTSARTRGCSRSCIWPWARGIARCCSSRRRRSRRRGGAPAAQRRSPIAPSRGRRRVEVRGERRVVADALGFARIADGGDEDVPFIRLDDLCAERATGSSDRQDRRGRRRGEVLRGARAPAARASPVTVCLNSHFDMLEQRGESVADLLRGFRRSAIVSTPPPETRCRRGGSGAR